MLFRSLRLKYNCVLRLGALTFVMPLEALAMLAAAVFAAAALAEQLRTIKRREELG